jgi:hypothetical protein
VRRWQNLQYRRISEQKQRNGRVFQTGARMFLLHTLSQSVTYSSSGFRVEDLRRQEEQEEELTK